MIWIELFILLAAIFIGARIGGIGLGLMGAVGLFVLVFVFQLPPGNIPIDVMLIILAVITATATMQAAGGMNYLVELAKKLLRSSPQQITFLGPLVAYFFTLFAGTGHVAYSILPVIAEVSAKSGVRPERPMSVSVIASQQAITASPMSAATAAMIALFEPSGLSLGKILMVAIPATVLGSFLAALVQSRVGKDLKDDPIYKEKLKDPDFSKSLELDSNDSQTVDREGRWSVYIFGLAVLLVVLLGSIDALRPIISEGPEGIERLSMANAIEIVMLSAAAAILIICKVVVSDVARGNIFKAGMEAVIAIFGIAWMGDTFIQANMETLTMAIQGMVETAPWSFALALFFMSILLYSQAATIQALMPLGISLGIPVPYLLGMFPAVNGYFFIPNYPTVVAAIGFDRTGTTRIGKYVLNHSFMLPGLVATFTSVSLGIVFSFLFL